MITQGRRISSGVGQGYKEVVGMCPSSVPVSFKSQREGMELREGDEQNLRVKQDGCCFIEKGIYLLYSIIAQRVKWE